MLFGAVMMRAIADFFGVSRSEAKQKFSDAMRAKQHDAFASVQEKYETLLTEFER